MQQERKLEIKNGNEGKKMKGREKKKDWWDTEEKKRGQEKEESENRDEYMKRTTNK